MGDLRSSFPRVYTRLRLIDEPSRGPTVEECEKPSLETIIEYAEQTISYHMRRMAWSLPEEHQEEIRQNAFLRVINAYQHLDEQKKWKAFVQTHCKGAILDYVRGGDGFEETGWAASDDAAVEPAPGSRLRHRVEIATDEDGDALEVGEVAGIFGVFSEIDSIEFKPNWDLLSRMAGVDFDLHLIAKLLLGFDQTEIAERYEKGITRERLSQKVDEFFARLDSPEFIGNRWIEQTIYALGLCEYYHIPNTDNGQGWNYQAFNLNDPDSFEQAREFYHPSLTGVRDERLKRSDIYGRYKVTPRSESADEHSDRVEQFSFELDS